MQTIIEPYHDSSYTSQTMHECVAAAQVFKSGQSESSMIGRRIILLKDTIPK